MRTQRVFLSAPMNIKDGSSGPSGVAGASEHGRSIFGLASTAAFPAVQSHQVLLIENRGIDTLTLGYNDDVPEGAHGIRVEIPSGHHGFLTDTAGGIMATYNGGPFRLVLGSFHYSVIDDNLNPDHPDAETAA